MNKPRNISHIEILHNIHNNSNLSQKETSQKTSLIIGIVNYILKSLLDIRFIKIDDFNKSNKKIKYLNY